MEDPKPTRKAMSDMMLMHCIFLLVDQLRGLRGSESLSKDARM